MKIDIETKNAWTRTLRSDRFVKITGSMASTIDCAGHNYRCILGVLCEVLKENGQLDRSIDFYDAYDALCAKGIATEFFSNMNDGYSNGALTFSEMADRIDAMTLDHKAFNHVAKNNFTYSSHADH